MGECSGPPESLVKVLVAYRFGVGYHMTVVKGENCNPMRVTKTVMQHVPGGELSTEAGAELAYTLPSNATGSFPELFEYIEGRRHCQVICTAPELYVHFVMTCYAEICRTFDFHVHVCETLHGRAWNARNC